jgi:dTDP-4-dehydrorhamnose 3,5-epimerase
MTRRDGSQGSWRTGRISGVWRRTLAFRADTRGEFGELWRESWNQDLPGPAGALPITVAQSNLSRSRPGVLRGLHLHLRQADVWVVLEGHPFIGLVDLRAALAGAGPVATETIDAQPGELLLIPEGVAHGFYARDAVTLLYGVTNEFDGTDEFGFAWNDPKAGVPWPATEPIISSRDAAAPSLEDAIRALTVPSQHSESR